ncbi:hypothetical protein [Streptomyces griseoluteus]|uniref:hypothetical protein n=1 Tax=Streptomyces griseoluteus TaxID=29306 RepID=UPI003688A551
MRNPAHVRARFRAPRRAVLRPLSSASRPPAAPSATALVGRLSYGTVPLSLLLATQRATGSYAASGAVLSLHGAAVVFLTPARASLVDRHGARRALLPPAVAHGGLLCMLAALTWRPGAPVPLIGGAAVLAGALRGHLPLPRCFALAGATAPASAGVALVGGSRTEPVRA